MQDRIPARERYYFYNTLSGLIKGLEGHKTVIDLRNDNIVSGTVRSVDGFMNVDLEDAVFYDSRGAGRQFSQFYVSSRNIRYVHIPKELKISDLINSTLTSFRRKPIKLKKKLTFKQKRAKLYHQDTLKSNFSTPGTSSDT